MFSPGSGAQEKWEVESDNAPIGPHWVQYQRPHFERAVFTPVRIG